MSEPGLSEEVCGRPRPPCEDCGEPMMHRTECGLCYGEDDYGETWWCDSDICHPDKDSPKGYINCCGC